MARHATKPITATRAITRAARRPRRSRATIRPPYAAIQIRGRQSPRSRGTDDEGGPRSGGRSGGADAQVASNPSLTARPPKIAAETRSSQRRTPVRPSTRSDNVPATTPADASTASPTAMKVTPSSRNCVVAGQLPAPVRQELREERQVEQDHLGVGEVREHRHPVDPRHQPCPLPARGRWTDQRVTGPARAPGRHGEVDQEERPRDPYALQHRRSGLQQRTEAQGGRHGVDGEAGRHAECRDDPGPAAAGERVRDDEDHVGTRRQADERDRDDEGDERGVVHAAHCPRRRTDRASENPRSGEVPSPRYSCATRRSRPLLRRHRRSRCHGGTRPGVRPRTPRPRGRQARARSSNAVPA